MSIAEKLTYLQTTKQLLKTEINKINNVLDDNSTFRSYPQELFNGYLDILNNGTDTLWNNLEKVSATGEEATLENVETAPIKMVLNGNTSQDGTPTPDTPVEVKVVKGENVVSVQGKNLLPYTEQTFNEEKNGVTFTGENGVYTISGVPTTNTRSSNYQLVNEYTIKDGDYIHFLNDKAYAYVTFGFTFTDGTTLAPAQAPVNRIYKFTSGYFGKKIRSIHMYVATTYDGRKITIKPMILNNVNTYTDFVPYSKTDYPISLGDIELCKINTYKDYFHKDSGKWYVHKAINKIVLNGTENWNKSNIFYANVFVSGALTTGGKIGLYSPYFKYSVDARNDNSIFVPGTTGTRNSYIWLKTDVATTVADFKTWLSNNNVILYYILATPTEEEITNSTLIEQLEAIYKAKSVKDKTYITQTNEELPFILDVEAIKEYEVN